MLGARLVEPAQMGQRHGGAQLQLGVARILFFKPGQDFQGLLVAAELDQVMGELIDPVEIARILFLIFHRALNSGAGIAQVPGQMRQQPPRALADGFGLLQRPADDLNRLRRFAVLHGGLRPLDGGHLAAALLIAVRACLLVAHYLTSSPGSSRPAFGLSPRRLRAFLIVLQAPCHPARLRDGRAMAAETILTRR